MTGDNPYQVNPELEVKTFTVGNENEKIVVIDNFLVKPENLVDYACEHQFSVYDTFYPGIKILAPSEYSEAVVNAIRPILEVEYDVSPAAELQKANCVLSLMTFKENELNVYQRAPHCDTTNYNQFAILLYLCDESHGGTAFYRHNATQYEKITADRGETYVNGFWTDIKVYGEPEQKYQVDSDKRYTKIGAVNATFNRMVIYRSCLLHSAFIHSEKSLHDNPAQGRLTANSFMAFLGS